MKTKGLFNNCIVTSEGALFCGEAESGESIYAHERDVEKGFRLFTTYSITIQKQQTRSVYGNEEYVCAEIRRPIHFMQMMEWMRLELLLRLLQVVPKKSQLAIQKLEGIVSIQRLKSVVGSNS